jgi:hypothetical protein
MNILFLGNSLLVNIYLAYQENNSIFGAGAKCSFGIDIGGWAPGFKLIDDKLIPSEREDKSKYPDIFYPDDLLNTDLNAFDAIVVVALGSIGGGLEELMSGYVSTTVGKVCNFKPKNTEISLPSLAEQEFIDMFNNYLGAQDGIKLLDLIAKFTSKKIIVEQPFHSIKIIEHPNWSLNKIYTDPVAAYKWITKLRNDFLSKKCVDLDLVLVSSLFGNIGFTPFEYINNSDLFHPNENYSKLLIHEISNSLLL